LIAAIKARLKEVGMFGIRGVSHLFKSMDKNGNRQIDINEFYWGLKEFGVNLTEEEAMGVLRIFDKDRNGTISVEEFLRALKGDLNNFRVGIIRKAYEKLDVNRDGSVRLDDIARLYDVSRHPDVVQGRKDPKQLYLEFMSKWDTQVADGIVTFEEFLDYFSDVSASIDSDDYFAAMMKNAWKIDV
jgi:Ca2+-binding EF-hand superfamily protein